MKKYIITIIILYFCSTAFSQNLSIAGQVKNVHGTAICDAVVQLFDENGILLNTVTTNQTGDFIHENLLTSANYSLSVEKGGDILNGLSTFDLVLISKHIMGEKRIADPFALYMADIDGSQSISVADLIALRRYILFLDSSLPIPAWQFFASTAIIDDPVNPWATNEVQIQRFENLTMSVDNANFIGYKTADVNSSAVPCEN